MSLPCTGAVVIHGGAGHTTDHADGCEAAARSAIDALAQGATATDAAAAAVRTLEDDGRFNAGRGAILGLDGETIELCASMMGTDGTLGAVACVRDVRHPVDLAVAVSHTPHCMLVGEGADRLARLLGLERARHDREHALELHRETVASLGGEKPAIPGVDNGEFRRLWNYAMPWDEAMRRHGHGTVGAVVRDSAGRFAVATSSGGVAPGLLGRVGDTPLVGSGFWCGPAGAIGATGIGEAILRRLLSRTVYGWVEDGLPLQAALDAGIALFDPEIDVGLIGITATEQAMSCNQGMPTAFASTAPRGPRA